MEHEESDLGDNLIPPAERPFRPWGASGVTQPGADRPAPRVPSPTGYGHHPGYPPQPVRVEHVYVDASSGVSGSGLASFILGILSFLIPWFGLLSFAAVALGLWSRGSSRVGRGSSGDGFAIAGLILGVTSLLLYLVLFRGLMFLFFLR